MKFIGSSFLQMYPSAALSTAYQTDLSKNNSVHGPVSEDEKNTPKISNTMNASVESVMEYMSV